MCISDLAYLRSGYVYVHIGIKFLVFSSGSQNVNSGLSAIASEIIFVTDGTVRSLEMDVDCPP